MERGYFPPFHVKLMLYIVFALVLPATFVCIYTIE